MIATSFGWGNFALAVAVVTWITSLKSGFAKNWLSHDFGTPLSWLGLAASFPIGSRLARPSLSVNPNLMSVQDAFRTRLALLQGAVPFDVAGARQLLAAAIR